MSVDERGEDANPYQSPQAADAVDASELRHISDKHRIMAWMFAVFVVGGVLDYLAGEDEGLRRVFAIAVGLIFAGQCIRWCHYDRLERQATEWRYFAACMLFCPGPLITFPVYLWWSRGLLQGTIGVLYAVGFLLLLVVVHAAVFSALTLFVG